MISALKTTFIQYNLKILRPKVTKNMKNLHKKFCEFPPRSLKVGTQNIHMKTSNPIFVGTQHPKCYFTAPRLGITALQNWLLFLITILLSVQDEPLSIDCGGGPPSTTPSSLLSTTSPLSSWMNDNGTEETEFGSTLDVDAIKVKNFISFVYNFRIHL